MSLAGTLFHFTAGDPLSFSLLKLQPPEKRWGRGSALRPLLQEAEFQRVAPGHPLPSGSGQGQVSLLGTAFVPAFTGQAQGEKLFRHPAP